MSVELVFVDESSDEDTPTRSLLHPRKPGRPFTSKSTNPNYSKCCSCKCYVLKNDFRVMKNGKTKKSCERCSLLQKSIYDKNKSRK